MPKKLVCPICKKDDVLQRVETIVQAGVSSGYYSGPSSGLAYINGKMETIEGYTSLYGSNSSNLAAILRPPIKPKKPQFSIVVIITSILSLPIIALASVFAVGSLAPLTTSTDSALRSIYIVVAIIPWSILLIAFLGFLFPIIIGINQLNAAEKEYNTKIPIWEKQMTRWQNIYFCHRDGIIINPENKKHSTPNNIAEFLSE